MSPCEIDSVGILVLEAVDVLLLVSLSYRNEGGSCERGASDACRFRSEDVVLGYSVGTVLLEASR